MSNIECRPKALVIADALELLDTDMCSPRDGAAELRRQHAEIERLRALTQCQCGDEFTPHDPGKCGNCCAGDAAALHAEIERITAERDALRAEADGLHVNMAHLLNALCVPMDGKYMGAAVEQVAQLRAELEARREKAVCAGTMQLIDEYATAVHDGADDRCAALRAKLVALLAQEPAAWLWQHADTGMTGFVDAWQLENGWAELNRHHQLTTALYTAPQPPLEVERLTDEAIAAEVERRWDTHSEPLTFGAGARWARDYCNSAWGLKMKEQQ